MVICSDTMEECRKCMMHEVMKMPLCCLCNYAVLGCQKMANINMSTPHILLLHPAMVYYFSDKQLLNCYIFCNALHDMIYRPSVKYICVSRQFSYVTSDRFM